MPPLLSSIVPKDLRPAHVQTTSDHPSISTVFSILKNPPGNIATTLAVLHAKPGAWAILSRSGKKIFRDIMKEDGIGNTDFYARLHLWTAIGAELARQGMLEGLEASTVTPRASDSVAVRGTVLPAEHRVLSIGQHSFVVDEHDIVRYLVLQDGTPE